MRIVVFEDGLHDNFYPLSLTRPLWELRSGLWSFRERFEIFFSRVPEFQERDIWYITRDYLAPYYRERLPGARINDYSVFSLKDEILFINAVAYPCASFLDMPPNTAYMIGQAPAAARLSAPVGASDYASIAELVSSIASSREDYRPSGDRVYGRVARHIWELVDWNPYTIKEDIALEGTLCSSRHDNTVTILGDSGQVYIEDGAVIEPYVLLDAQSGPIRIGEGVEVYAGSRIEGPCVVGARSRVLGARIRAGTSIGADCRVGGEVEQSILHGCVNKYHDGFIGHSYIGEWVNLGALTTNSDLKNDYRNVKVYTPSSRKKTGLMKVGCFIGDFVKTSIGTLINTGTSIGTGAMLVHAGALTPFHIPPFCWFMDGEIARPDWREEFYETCRTMMERRNVDLSGALIELLNTVYDMTGV